MVYQRSTHMLNRDRAFELQLDRSPTGKIDPKTMAMMPRSTNIEETVKEYRRQPIKSTNVFPNILSMTSPCVPSLRLLEGFGYICRATIQRPVVTRQRGRSAISAERS
jgi:hypothetical protein